MTISANASRRRFLQALSAGLLAAALPLPLRALASRALPANKTLIVVELFGGNDALNTLVPYRDPLYRRYRPTLALKANELATLTDELAFNRALSGAADVFQRGELAILQDVGYPAPNLSHFGSAAVWASGSNDAALKTGWAGRVLQANRRPDRSQDADGIILSGDQDLLAADGSQVLALQDSRAFLNAGMHQHIPKSAYAGNPAALHIIRQLEDNSALSQRIRGKLNGANRFTGWFTEAGYTEPQNAQAALLLWLMESGVRVPLYKISLSGFDLHANLRGEHERLLAKTDRLLLGLRKGLIEIGAWRDCVILVHSEFGRRPQENMSAGTDHGTCGPVLLMGGGVGGGLFGKRSSLEHLDAEGNPRFGIDFRTVYATVASRFWKLPDYSPIGPQAAPLDITL